MFRSAAPMFQCLYRSKNPVTEQLLQAATGITCQSILTTS